VEEIFGIDKSDDLKLLLGAIFAEELKEYTHWGWLSKDGFVGDFGPMLEDLKHYDVVSYPSGVSPRKSILSMVLYNENLSSCLMNFFVVPLKASRVSLPIFDGVPQH
jgi:hypothetical protein